VTYTAWDEFLVTQPRHRPHLRNQHAVNPPVLEHRPRLVVVRRFDNRESLPLEFRAEDVPGYGVGTDDEDGGRGGRHGETVTNGEEYHSFMISQCLSPRRPYPRDRFSRRAPSTTSP